MSAIRFTCFNLQVSYPLLNLGKTATLRLRDGSGLHHPAAAAVLALLADVCVVRLAVRSAGGPGRRESRCEVAPRTAQHLLDQHTLDRRSGHEKVYDFGRSRKG